MNTRYGWVGYFCFLETTNILNNGNFNNKIKDLAIKYGYQLYDIAFIDKDEKCYHYQHIKANRSNNAYSATKMFIVTAVGLF